MIWLCEWCYGQTATKGWESRGGFRKTNPETSSFGISDPNASAMSLEPMFAMHWRARDTWTGFREERSFFID